MCSAKQKQRQKRMKVELSEREGVNLLVLYGRIGPLECRAMQKALGQLVSDNKLRIAVGLSDVTYLDSTALGILVATMKSTRTRGGDLRLFGLSDIVMDIFRITRLYSVFEILPTMEDAITSFSEGGNGDRPPL